MAEGERRELVLRMRQLGLRTVVAERERRGLILRMRELGLEERRGRG